MDSPYGAPAAADGAGDKARDALTPRALALSKEYVGDARHVAEIVELLERHEQRAAELAEQRAVSFETAAQYAATIGALVYETSAKSSTGVDELFNEVARRLVVTRARATETGQPQLPDPLQDAPKSGCC